MKESSLQGNKLKSGSNFKDVQFHPGRVKKGGTQYPKSSNQHEQLWKREEWYKTGAILLTSLSLILVALVDTRLEHIIQTNSEKTNPWELYSPLTNRWGDLRQRDNY